MSNINEDATQSEFADNLRFYGDMRFKQLTLLIAMLSLVFAGIGQYGETILIEPVKIKEILAVAAMLFTGVLWVMEVRSSIYWAANKKQINNVWALARSAKFNWINATNAVLALYVSIFSFWVVCVHFWLDVFFITLICALTCVILCIFSITNYRFFYIAR